MDNCFQGWTEDEWKDAIAVGSTTSRDELILHIKAIPTKTVGAQLPSCGKSNNPSCCAGYIIIGFLVIYQQFQINAVFNCRKDHCVNQLYKFVTLNLQYYVTVFEDKMKENSLCEKIEQVYPLTAKCAGQIPLLNKIGQLEPERNFRELP